MSASSPSTGGRAGDHVPCEGLRVILASGFQPHYVQEVANAYARLEHAVEVIGGAMHEELRFDPRVRFLNLRGNDRKEPGALSELAKLARYYVRLVTHVSCSTAATIYDVSIGRPFLRCVLMYTAFRLMGKRIVYTAHNVLPHDRDSLVLRGIYWVIYRLLANAIVVHGQSIKDRIVSEFRVEPAKITVVPHGVYHPVDDPAVSKSEARLRLGLPHAMRIALLFGLQRPYKGTRFAIAALLRAPVPGMLLLIRGEAPEPAYAEELRADVAAASSILSIDSLLEAVSDTEMELLFKAADVTLLPYLEGSQSGVKYMSYAYGRPVLTSDAGSVSDDVVSGETGEVFPAGDEARFVSTLAEMLSHLPRYDEHRIRALTREEFSFDAAVRKVESVMKGLQSDAQTGLCAEKRRI